MRSCALLSILSATLLAGAVDEADPLKEELIKLEGVWKCVSIEWGGVKQEELARDYKLVLKGDTFKTISKGNVLDEGRVTRRDPTKNPKEFDFTYTGGRSKGRTMVGIYSLQADTYICCSAHIDLVVQRNGLSSFPQAFLPGPGVADAGNSVPLLAPGGEVDHVPLWLCWAFGGEDDLQ